MILDLDEGTMSIGRGGMEAKVTHTGNKLGSSLGFSKGGPIF